MSPRARPFALGLGRALFALAASASFAACAQDAAPVAIAPEPRAPAPQLTTAPAPTTAPTPRLPELLTTLTTPDPRRDLTLFPPPAPPAETQGTKAATFTIDYPPLGFKIAIALPEEGHLCIIIPESAQEPTACMGLDPGAMLDAFPEGPERPFGAAYARMGDWSYIVLLSPIGSGIQSREDIEEFVGGAVKGVRESSSLEPKLVVGTPNQKFDLMRVSNVPIVKFRIDAPHPPESPQYELATTMYYAAFGGRAAMVSFLTSPKDAEKVAPYAEATIQSLVLPPNEAPEHFGKPRAELNQQGTRTAIMIIGPLVAIGALVFLWLARSKPAEPETDPEGNANPPSAPKPGKRPAKGTSEKQDGAPSEEEDAPASDEDEDETGTDDEDGSDEDAPEKK